MKIKEGFKLRTVGGEYIVSGEGLGQIDFNRLIALNASAAYLWQAVDGKTFNAQTLANLLTDKYNITADRALKDAIEIMANWLEVGIVEE